MSVHGWKWLPEWITEKQRKNPLGSTEVYNPLDKCIREQGCFQRATGRRAPAITYHLSLTNISFIQNIRKSNLNYFEITLLHIYRIIIMGINKYTLNINIISKHFHVSLENLFLFKLDFHCLRLVYLNDFETKTENFCRSPTCMYKMKQSTCILSDEQNHF
jgi:hypothetical protein